MREEQTLSAIQGFQCLHIFLRKCKVKYIEVMVKDLVDVSCLREKLNVCIPKDHELAEQKELSMKQLNGFNCLLRDQILDRSLP